MLNLRIVFCSPPNLLRNYFIFAQQSSYILFTLSRNNGFGSWSEITILRNRAL